MTTEIMEIIGGGIFGAVTSLIGFSMKAKAEAWNNAIKGLTAQAQAVSGQTEIVNKSPFMAMTRRIFVLSLIAIVLGMAFGPMFDKELIVNIGQEVTTGSSWFFGLFDNTETKVVYDTLQGMVVPDYVGSMLRMAASAYLGASLTKV